MMILIFHLEFILINLCAKNTLTLLKMVKKSKGKEQFENSLMNFSLSSKLP